MKSKKTVNKWILTILIPVFIFQLNSRSILDNLGLQEEISNNFEWNLRFDSGT
jgi:predicted membrane-bound dolichyl-phosphate-mannose-protein mannosyltransferase